MRVEKKEYMIGAITGLITINLFFSFFEYEGIIKWTSICLSVLWFIMFAGYWYKRLRK